MKYFNGIDLQKMGALKGAPIDPLSSAPSSPVVGQIYYDTGLLQGLFWNGTAWANKATDSPLLNGQNAAYYLARANHTGTQLSATISDLATTVQAYRLDQFAVPTADISLNSHKLTNVTDPTNPQDGATKNYVDTQVSNSAAGIDSKPSVRVVATSNITLSGTQTIDGISVVVGDRVLCKAQTTASQNGVYVVASGAWTRATDADATGELTPGAFWFVEEGTSNAKTQWRIENTGTITLGTTSITINQFGASVGYTAGNGIAIGGSAISVQAVGSGGISVVSGGVQLDTTIAARKAAFVVGNGSATSIALAHNLGTKDVAVSVRLASTDEGILVDWVATDANTVTLTFASAPASNAIKAVVIG